MKKTKITNLVSSILSGFAIYKIIQIDNMSRMAEHIDTDYHMRSLPFLYLIIISITVSIITSLILIKKTSK